MKKMTKGELQARIREIQSRMSELNETAAKGKKNLTDDEQREWDALTRERIIVDGELRAQMNEQEKYVYELEQREKAIEEKERQLTLAENKNTAQHILSDKHLDLDLVDFVLAEDAETMNSNITRLERAFKRSVKAEVETILRGKTPPASNSTDATTLTKEKFKNLSLMEKQNLYNTDRELYNQLIS